MVRRSVAGARERRRRFEGTFRSVAALRRSLPGLTSTVGCRAIPAIGVSRRPGWLLDCGRGPWPVRSSDCLAAGARRMARRGCCWACRARRPASSSSCRSCPLPARKDHGEAPRRLLMMSRTVCMAGKRYSTGGHGDTARCRNGLRPRRPAATRLGGLHAPLPPHRPDSRPPAWRQLRLPTTRPLGARGPQAMTAATRGGPGRGPSRDAAGVTRQSSKATVRRFDVLAIAAAARGRTRGRRGRTKRTPMCMPPAQRSCRRRPRSRAKKSKKACCRRPGALRG